MIVVIVVVATSAEEVPAVTARLAALEAGPVDVVDPGGARRLVRTRVDDPWRAERITAALRDDGRIAVTRPVDGVRHDAWVEHTRPVDVGARLRVCFAWSEHARVDPTNTIELGLGGFGSGAHPTTRMLLEELVARIDGGERVLDVGCGSGVLGLAALRLGAGNLVAVDLKPEAVEATRRNADLNGLAGPVSATTAPLSELDGPFDAVLANIGRDGIVAVAPELPRLLAPGGWLGVSGFSPAQCPLVGGFLRPLVEVARHGCGAWAAVVLATAAAAGCHHPRPGGH